MAAARHGPAGEDVRQMAAVLLRRLISNEFEEFYSKVNPEIDSTVLLSHSLCCAPLGLRGLPFRVEPPSSYAEDWFFFFGFSKKND